MTNGNNGFSPTQQQILAFLADGMPHKRVDLLRHLGLEDTPRDRQNLANHLTALRQRLKRRPESAVCSDKADYEKMD